MYLQGEAKTYWQDYLKAELFGLKQLSFALECGLEKQSIGQRGARFFRYFDDMWLWAIGFTHFQAIDNTTAIIRNPNEKRTKPNFLNNSQNHRCLYSEYISFPTCRRNLTAWTRFLYHKCAANQILGNSYLFLVHVIFLHLLNNLSGWSNFPPCKHSINSGATKRNKANFSGKYSGKYSAKYLNDVHV